MLLEKALKPGLTCKFHFIFYFHLLKSCNFNISDLLLLINNSVGVRHLIINLAVTSMADGVC